MAKGIQTDRLVLRRLRSADAARVAELIGNLSVSRWLTRVPFPYQIKDAQQFIDRHLENDDTLAITRSEEIIGCCAIDAELGYWLGQPYWGRGYMSEATLAIVERYFRKTRDDLHSGFILGNVGSEKILTKLGFTPTHTDEAVCSSLGRLVVLQKMTLTFDSWEARA
ncbi:MAG: GNAT family N-acetyltransferase [Paracoccaceae bacterium]|nr:GNAT family N-acetyltransferase [Paracoccaceae bacterium]